MMFKIKKIWMFLVGLMMAFSVSSLCLWQNPYTSTSHSDRYQINNPIVSGKEISDGDSIWQWSHSINQKSKWEILQFWIPNKYDTSLGRVMALIQIAINWILWILAFVALLYLLYCGFLVFSAGNDEKNSAKWKKWISTAAIALAWIWLSWLIISAMVRFITKIATKWITQ